ncbi:MAG: SAM-dependent methyltransferase [Gammaproteobacteria bacterium]|nr:SAM-dependent methyltransferase [Gammaproteobacteria bacterium]
MNIQSKEVVAEPPSLSDKEFELFRELIYKQAGIALSPLKKSLVENRLSKRLKNLGLNSFLDYHKQVMSDPSKDEMQVLVDLLTTNETYFFREAKHFDYLKEHVLSKVGRSQGFSLWSAASSTGEEPYSLAMTLADSLGVKGNWQIIATDINTEVLNTARTGRYTLSEKDAIPSKYLHDYCLKGIRSQEGAILIDKALRSSVRYEQLNLMGNWDSYINAFDVIFIRNVMIYFDIDTRKKLLDRIADKIKMGGYLFVSHSETLHKLTDRFELVTPSIYTRVR